MAKSVIERLLEYRNEISRAQEIEFTNRDTWTAIQSVHLRMAEFANRQGIEAHNALGRIAEAEAYANVCLEQLTYLD